MFCTEEIYNTPYLPEDLKVWFIEALGPRLLSPRQIKLINFSIEISDIFQLKQTAHWAVNTTKGCNM